MEQDLSRKALAVASASALASSNPNDDDYTQRCVFCQSIRKEGELAKPKHKTRLVCSAVQFKDQKTQKVGECLHD
jgi:hypothetical protein